MLIKTLTNEQFEINIDVNSIETILDLKKIISEKRNINSESFKLLFAGKILNDSDKLSDQKIDNNCCLIFFPNKKKKEKTKSTTNQQSTDQQSTEQTINQQTTNQQITEQITQNPLRNVMNEQQNELLIPPQIMEQFSKIFYIHYYGLLKNKNLLTDISNNIKNNNQLFKTLEQQNPGIVDNIIKKIIDDPELPKKVFTVGQQADNEGVFDRAQETMQRQSPISIDEQLNSINLSEPLSDEDKQNIKDVIDMGYQLMEVVQFYIASGKDKQMTINLLMN